MHCESVCFVGKCVGGETERSHSEGCVSGRGKGERVIGKSIVFSLLSKGEKQKFEKLEEILRKKKKFCVDSQ